jgi:chemotaxis signal transduction protein
MHLRIRLGDEHYALGIEYVLEVLELGELTPVPGSAATVLGLHNLRGEIVASVDLRAVLGIAGGGEPRHMVVVAALPEATATTGSAFLIGGALLEGTLVGVVDVPAVLGSVAGSPASEIS